MRIFPMGKTNLPNTSLVGDVFTKGKDYFISFKNDGKTRVLEFFMDNFKDGNKIEGKIQLSDEPKESIVICTPFEKDGCFYYNQKQPNEEERETKYNKLKQLYEIVLNQKQAVENGLKCSK